MTCRIVFLDVWLPAVRDEVRRVAPPGFEPSFADSYEPAHQHALAASADVLVPGFARVDAALVGAAARLRLVHTWGVGIDGIDLDALRARGVPLAITSGGNAGPVAELALALMLSVYRRLPYATGSLRDGRWVTGEMRASCLQVAGKTVGLIGFGHIARVLARRLAGFDVRIVYFSRTRADAATETALGAEYLPLDALLQVSDIVSLHLRLDARTTGLVDAGFLARMKPGAVLINTARGGLVDEAALLDALRSGRLRGAGLDTFVHEPLPPDSPLLGLDTVVATPHVGGGVFDNVGPVARRIYENVRRHLSGEPLPASDVILPGGPAPTRPDDDLSIEARP